MCRCLSWIDNKKQFTWGVFFIALLFANDLKALVTKAYFYCLMQRLVLDSPTIMKWMNGNDRR
jgi:hypothetical protein